MAKRVADKELTHDNWEVEDEDEEAGVFRIASKAVMETREVRKAKRRLGGDGGNAGSSGSIFKGITFGIPSSGLGNSKPLGVPLQTSTAAASFAFASTAAMTATSTAATPSPSAAASTESNIAVTTETESQYRQNLRRLNETVLCWITDHIKKDPYCILTPVFSDYEKYIQELNGDSASIPSSASKVTSVSEKTAPSPAAPSGTAPATTAASGFSFTSSSAASGPAASTTTTSSGFGTGFFSFGAKSAGTADKGPSPAAPTTATSGGFSFSATVTTTSSTSGFGSGFAFGATSSKETSSTTAPAFSFGVQPSKGASSSGFSFGIQASKEAPASSTAGFSFGIQPSKEATSPSSGFGFGLKPSASSDASETKAAPQEAGQSEGGDDDNYVPPKAEVVEIKEDDAFYTVKCKLYFKLDNEFKERGVGNLYLKPCGDKTQLLIRAATTLGNILLNIILNKSIPVTRQRNNVTLMCVPNPPVGKSESTAPVCMLIRVKTEDEAENLLKQINDHKV